MSETLRDRAPTARAYPAELLTPEQMARADAAAVAAGVPGSVLMENAGRAVFRAIRRKFRPCRVVVLCGPGNNGGDGYVVARLLDQAGWPVRLAALAPPMVPDAREAASRWRGTVQLFEPAVLEGAGLVVDAMFGAGLSRPIGGTAAEVIMASWKASLPVVAVDLPSGISGLTGQGGPVAVGAALTVTFFRLKPGHILLPGRRLCGEVECADIGIPDSVLSIVGADTRLNGPRQFRLFTAVQLAEKLHKWSRGSVTVLAGPGMPGAARLAGAAARRAGAGHVTLAAPDAATAALLRTDPGMVVHEGAIDPLLEDPRRQAWVIGPGGGSEAPKLLVQATRAGRQVVADADALRDPAALADAALITPHEGEFTRLFGAPGRDRVAAVRRAARQLGTVVLLKGPTTIIAAPDGQVVLNANAPAFLATAGTGDTLAGIAAAWLAQGAPPLQAACAAAWLSGEAARLVGPGLIAEDLAAALPLALAKAALDAPGPMALLSSS
jgi:hydroxyethylthiazole kinase-like uncharacterized protein yjeF